MPEESSGLLIIGVGNLYRCDDAAGLHVVRALGGMALPGVTILEQPGEGTALMAAWQHAAQVILVDAVLSGSVPAGTLHRLEAQAERVPPDLLRCSTHVFGVAEAVELARVLGQLPPHLVIHGIEGRNFGAGEALSPEVARAVPELVQRILLETHTLLAAPQPAR